MCPEAIKLFSSRDLIFVGVFLVFEVCVFWLVLVLGGFSVAVVIVVVEKHQLTWFGIAPCVR